MQCAECGDVAAWQCTRCRGAFYCSTACQRARWISGHSVVCIGELEAVGPTQTRVAVGLGDFFFVGAWTYEVVEIEGVPGAETRITATYTNANPWGKKLAINLYYDDGWKARINTEEQDQKEVGMTHVRARERPWWKAVPLAGGLPDGIVPFGTVRELDGLSLDSVKDALQDMEPGDHYQWLGLHFKFFDFARPDHRGHKSTLALMSQREVCEGGDISDEWYLQSLAHSRHMLTITFVGRDRRGNAKEALASMLIAEPAGVDSVYYWTICAATLEVFDSFQTYWDGKRPISEIRASFGVLLQAISGTHHRAIGTRKAQLDATELSNAYYEKIGYTHIHGMQYEMALTEANLDTLWRRVPPKLRQLKDFVEAIPDGASYAYRTRLERAVP